jgi:putative membrane protein
MRLIIRLIVNAVALWFVVEVFPGSGGGVGYQGNLWPGLLLVAVVFGLVNAFIKPIVKLLSLPARILTFGLFGLVINALMLIITAAITDLTLDGPGAAFLAALVISLVSIVLNWFVPDKG